MSLSPFVTAPLRGLVHQRAALSARGPCTLTLLRACSLREEHWRSLQHCSSKDFLQRDRHRVSFSVINWMELVKYNTLCACQTTLSHLGIYVLLKLHILSRVLREHKAVIVSRKKISFFLLLLRNKGSEIQNIEVRHCKLWDKRSTVYFQASVAQDVACVVWLCSLQPGRRPWAWNGWALGFHLPTRSDGENGTGVFPQAPDPNSQPSVVSQVDWLFLCRHQPFRGFQVDNSQMAPLSVSQTQNSL